MRAGGITFVLVTTRTGTGVNAGVGANTAGASSNDNLAAQQTRYFHHDHLGSIAAISNEIGTMIERMAYDPWGKRRNVNGTQDTGDGLIGNATHRGYTEHEHLDEVGVIHMNGRVYDPLLGRMMSADPFIQAPTDLQSYNRYVYVMNNPLAFTDPSGYFSWSSFRDSVVKPVVVIAAAYYASRYVKPWALLNGYATSTAGASVLAGAAGGFAAGFSGSALYGGNLGQATAAGVTGGVTGALFGAAGTVGGQAGADTWQRYAAHAAAGCASAMATDGNCRSGAAAAVLGKWVTNQTQNWNELAQGAATTVSGGVASVINGGTFANGARTAAFGYLFNCVMSKCYQYSPRSGGSMTLKDSSSNGYYGRQSTLEALDRLDAAWLDSGEGRTVTVTEISRHPGATPGHDSHQDGEHVDFRPLTTDGKAGTWRSPNYDRAATQKFIDTIRNLYPQATILFNDPNIRGASFYKGHDNHIHVRFKK